MVNDDIVIAPGTTTFLHDMTWHIRRFIKRPYEKLTCPRTRFVNTEDTRGEWTQRKCQGTEGFCNEPERYARWISSIRVPVACFYARTADEKCTRHGSRENNYVSAWNLVPRYLCVPRYNTKRITIEMYTYDNLTADFYAFIENLEMQKYI